MATLVGTEVTFADMLTDLVRLDFDAAAAYEAAIDRLQSGAFKAAMRKFKADHLRHTRDLGACLREMGHEAPTEGGMMQVLTTGKVIVAGLVGDAAILTAMRTNEDDTVTAYDRAVAHPDCPQDLLQLLQRAQKDEHRHREWIVTVLKKEKTTRRAARRPAQPKASARRKTSARGKATATRTARASPKRVKRATRRRASR